MLHRPALALALLALTAACGGSTPVAAPSASSVAPSPSASPSEIVVAASPEPIVDPSVSAPAGRDDEEFFADGMFGYYGGADFTYGAIEGCNDFFAGGGESSYVLVDGQTKNTITLELLYGEENDIAELTFRNSPSEEVFLTENVTYEFVSIGMEQRMKAQLSTGETLYVLVPDEGSESESCEDPVRS